MPHCILEYSANVPGRPDLRSLLLRLHEALAATGEFRLRDVKSRAVRHEVFAVEDGAADRSFVALEIRILEGRSDALKAAVSERALELLTDAFPEAFASGRCSFSVEVSDLHRASYRRRAGPQDPAP